MNQSLNNKIGGDFMSLQNNFPILKIFLDQFQNLFLDPEKTVNMFVKILDALLTSGGFEGYALLLQKPLLDLNNLLVFILNFIRQKYITSYINFLSLIPNLSEYLGDLDMVTNKTFDKFEFENKLPEQLPIILKIENHTEMVLKLIENKLDINNNLPHILKSEIIKNGLDKLFSKSIIDKKNLSFKKDNSFNSEYDSLNDVLYICFDNNQEFVKNIIDPNPDLKQWSDDFDLKQLSDDPNIKIEINSFILDQWLSIKETIFDELNNLIEESKNDNDSLGVNSFTKYVFCGHGINCCFSILLSLDKQFEELFCKFNIVRPNTYIISLGMPSFGNELFQKYFLEKKNINLYRFIIITDIISFINFNQKTFHLALPNILCSPNVVNNFYNQCCNKKVKDISEIISNYKTLKIFNSIDLDTNNISKSLTNLNKIENYKNQIDLIFKTYFKVNEYQNYIPSKSDNKYLGDPFYISNIV